MNSISASTLLPSLSIHGHGHRRGAAGAAQSLGSNLTGAAGSSGGSTIGQLPVGVSSALFTNLVQSFQQALGTQPLSGTASTASTGQQQELQAFQHSLLQALKQDGLSSNGTGNVVSSLNSLIAQLGPDGKATAATSTLTATFQNLMTGVNGAAASGSASPASSGLQNFLNNLLQQVQAGGVQSLASTGTNVNTHV